MPVVRRSGALPTSSATHDDRGLPLPVWCAGALYGTWDAFKFKVRMPGPRTHEDEAMHAVGGWRRCASLSSFAPRRLGGCAAQIPGLYKIRHIGQTTMTTGAVRALCADHRRRGSDCRRRHAPQTARVLVPCHACRSLGPSSQPARSCIAGKGTSVRVATTITRLRALLLLLLQHELESEPLPLGAHRPER